MAFVTIDKDNNLNIAQEFRFTEEFHNLLQLVFRNIRSEYYDQKLSESQCLEILVADYMSTNGLSIETVRDINKHLKVSQQVIESENQKRLEKSTRLFVNKQNKSSYFVTNPHELTVYQIISIPKTDKWSCNCKDTIFRNQQREHCKHIYAVLQYIENEKTN